MVRSGISAGNTGLNVVFQSSSDAVLVVGRRQRLVGLNPAAQQLLGWKEQDVGMLSCRMMSCQSPTGRMLCERQCMAMRTLATSKPIKDIMMVVKSVDGDALPVEATFHPFRESGEMRNAWVAIFVRDKSELFGQQESLSDLTDAIVERNLTLHQISGSLNTIWKEPVVSIQSSCNALQTYFSRNLGESGLRQVERIRSAARALDSAMAKLQGQVRSSRPDTVGESSSPREGQRGDD